MVPIEEQARAAEPEVEAPNRCRCERFPDARYERRCNEHGPDQDRHEAALAATEGWDDMQFLCVALLEKRFLEC